MQQPASQAEIDAVVAQAREHLAQRRLAEARQAAEQAIARAPYALRPRVLLSHALLQEGRDWDAAEQALREVLRLDPRSEEAWRNLVTLLRLRQRSAEAFAACQAGLTHCPECAELVLQEGLVLHERRDYRSAEARRRDFLERRSGGPLNAAGKEDRWVARHCLAKCYREQARYREAEVLWQQLLTEQPERGTVLAELADVYLRQGRLPEAEEAAQRLGSFPWEAQAAELVRARLHLARREFAAARQLLGQLIAADPQALGPRVVLSYVH